MTALKKGKGVLYVVCAPSAHTAYSPLFSFSAVLSFIVACPVRSVKVSSSKNWESMVERQIREAQERGEFDNLPGMGVPLDLTPNPYALGRELAFKILKDAGCAPDWIELDKSIRGELEDAREALDRQWARHQARMDELEGRSDRWAQAEMARSQTAWTRAVSAFEAAIGTVNERIGNLNLKVPSPRFQRTKIEVSRELERLQEPKA